MFLSQQSAMSVRKTAGFLSPNRISELVWDSESEETGASSNRHLGNRILCIFRQPLKYLCFSYSFLDGLRKCVDSIPPCEKYTGNDGRQTRTALNKVWSVSVRDGDVGKMSRVNCDWCEEKSY